MITFKGLTAPSPDVDFTRSALLHSSLITHHKELTMKTETEISSMFAMLNEERNKSILAIAAADDLSHFDAMLKYDGEIAPKTTDRKKFVLIGCDFPPCFVPKDEAAAEEFVERVLTAYAMWNEQVILNPDWTFTQQAAALQKVMDDEISLLAPKPDQHYCVIDLRGVQI